MANTRHAPLAPANGHTPVADAHARREAERQALAQAVVDAQASLHNAVVAGQLPPLPVMAYRPDPPLLCAHCLAVMTQWEHAHAAQIRDVQTRHQELIAAAMAAQAAGEPVPPVPDPATLLPEDLQATMPQVRKGVTVAAGTLVCAVHLQGPAGGRQPLLVASAGVDMSVLARSHGMALGGR